MSASTSASGSSTQRLSLPRQGTVIPFHNIPDLPTFDVDVMVMPPHHFEGESGPVMGLATTTGYVACVI